MGENREHRERGLQRTLAKLSPATREVWEELASGANLSKANLSGIHGWTKEQLGEAKSLEGATMPNGQKYEDWRKSKDSNGDGKKDGSS